jgi:hypothetical protein
VGRFVRNPALDDRGGDPTDALGEADLVVRHGASVGVR